MSLELDTLHTQITQGIVYRKSQGHYAVRINGHVVDCEISSRLRKVLEYPIAAPTSRRHRVLDVHEIRVIDPIAIGDRVEFLNANDETGIITNVLPRRNQISRQDPGPRPVAQVIAANVDYIVHITAAAQPVPKWELLDRYIASAEKAEIASVIVFTKADVLQDERVLLNIENYRRIGYKVFFTSAITGEGIDAFMQKRQPAWKGR